MKRFDLMFGVNVRGTYLCTAGRLAAADPSARAGRHARAEHVAALSMKRALVREPVA